MAAALTCLSDGTQNAVAYGDTRTLNLYQEHTKESVQITFKRNGTYDAEALKQMNWFLRDWRRDEQTRMDPRLFDVIWEVYREVGAQEAIHVVSAYRAPETNAMLRRRSRVVAEHSQHILGKAMDFYLPDVSMSRVREVGMRLQDGGVGFYPNAFNPFVHLDVGSVRAWPRMGRDQLARLFPDGRTVHVPRDGKPFEGYELAKAEILQRGGQVAGYSTYAEGEETGGGRKSLWAMLFGGGEDEDTEYYRQAGSPQRTAPRVPANAIAFAATGGNSDDAGTRDRMALAPQQQQQAQPAPARGRRIETAAAGPVAPVAPAPEAPSLLDPTPQDPAPQATAASVRLVDAVPQPPRRPAELGMFLVAAPMPPERPVLLASLADGLPVAPAEVRGQMRTLPSAPRPAAADDRVALRTLFEAAVTPTGPARTPAIRTARARAEPLAQEAAIVGPSANVRMVFSAATRAEAGTPGTGGFSGPAVKPLPILR